MFLLSDILKGADLNQLSAKKVRRQLEEKFNSDFTHRYVLIVLLQLRLTLHVFTGKCVLVAAKNRCPAVESGLPESFVNKVHVGGSIHSFAARRPVAANKAA